jgi:hypothetical protein
MRLDFTVQAFDLKQMPAVDYAAGEDALEVAQAVQVFDFQVGPSRWEAASEPTNQLVLWPLGVPNRPPIELNEPDPAALRSSGVWRARR